MKRDEVLAEALKTLGGTILYPTDTVWGLGCDATNPEAVAKIYAIKRRSEAKSLVLLASDLDMVAKYVRQVPSMAVDLVEVNDKPMTIIYPDAQAGVEGEPGDRWHLAWNAVAEDGSVGMRIPLFDFCRDLAFKLGRPVVSTSANISGEPTPARFSEIPQEIKDAVDFVVPPSIDTDSTGKASQIIKVPCHFERSREIYLWSSSTHTTPTAASAGWTPTSPVTAAACYGTVSGMRST